MTGDEMEVDGQISGILDRLGREMQHAGTALRFGPYSTVEQFIENACAVLAGIQKAGKLSKEGDTGAAIELLSVIEVTEVEF